MPRTPGREAAREILSIIPLVMRSVAAELRAAGEMPAPAHFGLLTLLNDQPRTLTELALLQGVSLPTMSNSISTLVDRGWARRSSPAKDRRVVLVEITAIGQATVQRVGRAAEQHLNERLAGLDAAARGRLREGLAVLRQVFEAAPPGRVRRTGTRPRRTST